MSVSLGAVGDTGGPLGQRTHAAVRYASIALHLVCDAAGLWHLTKRGILAFRMNPLVDKRPEHIRQSPRISHPILSMLRSTVQVSPAHSLTFQRCRARPFSPNNKPADLRVRACVPTPPCQPSSPQKTHRPRGASGKNAAMTAAARQQHGVPVVCVGGGGGERRLAAKNERAFRPRDWTISAPVTL